MMLSMLVLISMCSVMIASRGRVTEVGFFLVSLASADFSPSSLYTSYLIG